MGRRAANRCSMWTKWSADMAARWPNPSMAAWFVWWTCVAHLPKQRQVCWACDGRARRAKRRWPLAHPRKQHVSESRPGESRQQYVRIVVGGQGGCSGNLGHRRQEQRRHKHKSYDDKLVSKGHAMSVGEVVRTRARILGCDDWCASSNPAVGGVRDV